MTYQFMKVLINVKYFLFVNIVTMLSIDSYNLKWQYLSFYEINNNSEIETN